MHREASLLNNHMKKLHKSDSWNVWIGLNLSFEYWNFVNLWAFEFYFTRTAETLVCSYAHLIVIDLICYSLVTRMFTDIYYILCRNKYLIYNRKFEKGKYNFKLKINQDMYSLWRMSMIRGLIWWSISDRWKHRTGSDLFFVKEVRKMPAKS